MRILFVSNYKKGVGGISVQVDLLMQNLKNEGYKVGLFPTKRTLFKRILAFFQLFLVVKNYDIIHAHGCSGIGGFLPIIYTVIVGKLSRKKIIVTYHGGEAEAYFSKNRRFIRFFLLKANNVVVLSGFLEKIFDKYSIPTTIIPNIISIDRKRFRIRDKINPHFVSIRNLYPIYNVMCIIKAFELYKSRNSSARLTVLGDGSERKEIELYITKNQIKDVQIVGSVSNSDIYDYLDKADVLISAPLIDNMPVSILEAFNAGLLVISSNVGGVPYMVEDHETGLLFESNNTLDLLNCMIESVDNQHHSIEMIRKAHKELDKYQWEFVKDKVFNVYGMY